MEGSPNSKENFMLETERAYSENELPLTRVLGECIGAVVNNSNGQPIVQLCIEDDESWFPKNIQFHAYWLDDAIEVLTKLRKIVIL